MENEKLAILAALIFIIFVGVFFLNEPQSTIKKTYTINYSSISATKQIEIKDTKTETIFISELRGLNLGLLKVIPKTLDSNISSISFSHNGVMNVWKNDPIVYFTSTGNTLLVKSTYSQNSDISSINLILPNTFIESLSADQKEILIKELEKFGELNLNEDKANELENTLSERLVKAFSEDTTKLIEKYGNETKIFFEEDESLFEKIMNILKRTRVEVEQEDIPLILSLELNKDHIDPYADEKIEIKVTSSVQVSKEDFELIITTKKGELVRTLKPINDLEANNPETFFWDGRNEKGEIVVKDLEYEAQKEYLVQLYHKKEFNQSKAVTLIRVDDRCPTKIELREKFSETDQLTFELSESKSFEKKSFVIVQPGEDYENVINTPISVEGEIEEFLLLNLSDSYVLCEGKIKERNDWSEEDQTIFNVIRNADATELTYNGLEIILSKLEITGYKEKLDNLVQEKILLAGKTQVAEVLVDVTQKIDWVDPPSYFGGNIVFDYSEFFAIGNKFVEIDLRLTPTKVKFKNTTETTDEENKIDTSLQTWERPNGQIAKEEYVELIYNENNEKIWEYKETLIYDLTGKLVLKIIEEKTFVDGYNPVQGEAEKTLYYIVENGQDTLYKSIIKEYEYVFVGGATLYDYDKLLGITTHFSLPELGIENAVIEEEKTVYFTTGKIAERSFKQYDFRGETVSDSRKTEYRILDITQELIVTKNYEGDFDAQHPKLTRTTETSITKPVQGSEEEEVITIREFDEHNDLISVETITSETKPLAETSSNQKFYSKTGEEDFSSQTTIYDEEGNTEKEIEQKSSNNRNSYSEKTYIDVDGSSRIGREIGINSSGGKTVSEETIYEYLSQADKVTKRCFIDNNNDTNPNGKLFKIIKTEKEYLDSEKYWPNTEIEELFQSEELSVYDSLSIDEYCPSPDSLPNKFFEEAFYFNEGNVKKIIETKYVYEYDEEDNPLRELYNETNIYKKKGNLLELIGSISSRKNYITNEVNPYTQYAELPFQDKCEEITGLSIDFVESNPTESRPIEIVNENSSFSETGETELSTEVIHYFYYESGETKIIETNLFSEGKLITKETEHFDLENTLICSQVKVDCEELKFEC